MRQLAAREVLLRRLLCWTLLLAAFWVPAAEEYSLGDAIAELERLSQRTTHHVHVHGLPLFTLGIPWAKMEEFQAGGERRRFPLQFFEPRYTWLARRIQDAAKAGIATFGYSDAYPPRTGTTGVLIKVPLGSMHWSSPDRAGAVVVECEPGAPFKVLKVRSEQPPETPAGTLPLFVADVEVFVNSSYVAEQNESSNLTDHEVLQYVLLNLGVDAKPAAPADEL